MRLAWLFFSLLLMLPAALGQGLPELGDVSGAVLSPQMERSIGEEAMRDIRFRDPSYLDDPELTDYINSLGHRLTAVNPDARQDFEFFMVQDNTINAFAMPGGFVGVHTGLLLAAQSESEVASVLAHEIAHVTQHHIARHARQTGADVGADACGAGRRSDGCAVQSADRAGGDGGDHGGKHSEPAQLQP